MGRISVVRVNIDFNNNVSFYEPDELIFSSDNSGPVHTGTLYSPTIFISNTLLRMRVISDWYPNTITPCGSPQYGQAEDYGVIFRLPGDLNYDNQVDLRDALLALQVMACKTPIEIVHTKGDVNNDGWIDLEDVIYILQKITGLRT